MKKSNPTKKKTVAKKVTKTVTKKVYTRKITWQVDEDGPVHEVPEGAILSFYTKEGEVRVTLFPDGQLAIMELR